MVDPSAIVAPGGAGAVGLLTVAVLATGAGEQLAHVRRKTGIGPVLGAVLAVAFLAGAFSVPVLGGETGGRFDYPFLAAMFAYAAGLFGVGVAVATLRRYLLVVRADRTATGAVEGGQVSVSGTAEPADGTTTAPFSGDEALCWRCRVMEREVVTEGPEVDAESVGVESDWTVEYADSRERPFEVDDGSGPVHVEPTGADWRLAETTEVVVEHPEDPPEPILSFVEANLAAVGYAAEDRRYEEDVLAPGEEVTVAGRAVGDPPRIDAERGDCLVSTGSLSDVQSELRRRTRTAAVGGVAFTVLGFWGMLAVSGAL